jgi:hypothetical protein
VAQCLRWYIGTNLAFDLTVQMSRRKSKMDAGVADAEAEGELTLTGDRQLFDRFVTWFPLPEKI